MSLSPLNWLSSRSVARAELCVFVKAVNSSFKLETVHLETKKIRQFYLEKTSMVSVGNYH
jgi:hypothetical protein